MRLSPVFAVGGRACCWQDVLDVAVFQLGVDVDIVGVEDLGVVEGLEDGLLEDFGEEGVLVGRLVTDVLAGKHAIDALLHQRLRAHHQIDLALALVADDHGRQAAAVVAPRPLRR